MHGNRNNVKRGENIQKLLEKNNISAKIIISSKPGEITDIVRDASKIKTRFYIIGGDGTLNEAVTGLIGTDSEIVVIPAGTGNDFIKSISKYTSMRKIVLASINTPATPTDIIKFNKDKYCVNILNLGFDAKIAANVDKFRRIPFISGSGKYNLAIFYTLFKNKNYRLKIRINDTVLKGNFTLAAIANGKFYGGGVCPEPEADTTDGILNVCVVTSSSFLEKLFLLPKYKKGKHEKIKQLTHYTTQDITIASYRKIPVSVDGEVIFTNKIHAKVLPKAVNIVHIK